MNLCSKKNKLKIVHQKKFKSVTRKKKTSSKKKKIRIWHSEKKKMKSPQEKKKSFFLSFFEKSEFVQFILKIVQKKEEILFEKIP